MTRENKLALVIGFALILFVGILISDHFSAADRQHSSTIGEQVAGHIGVSHQDPQLLDSRAERQARRDGDGGSNGNDNGNMAVNARPFQPDADDDDRPAGNEIHVPDLREHRRQSREQGGDRSGRGDDDDRTDRTDRDNDRDVDVIRHQVSAGESLSTICQQYYGTSRLTRDLAEFNDLDNPDQLVVGRTLRIPRNAADLTLDGPAGGRAGGDDAADDQPRYREYTFQSGDTLSRVAARLLGSEGKWRELYELNRDVIDNPDAVPVGTTIKVPADSNS